MIPVFELHRPRTVDEASALLESLGDDAALYAGGTELLLVMKLGFADYPHLVDVKRIPALGELGEDHGRLRIGAAVTHRAVERSELVRSHWPALGEMTSNLANPRVRGTGTVGGNLCFADPHSDVATFLLAADAELVLQRGQTTSRRLGVAEFLRGSYLTALDPTELLVAVEVPAVPPRAAFAHERFAIHERPTATVTACVAVDSGQVADVRLSVGSVGPMPVRLTSAEQMLLGRTVDELGSELLVSAVRAAEQDMDVIEDAEGSTAYKHQLVRTLVLRAFRSALDGTVAR